MTNRKNKGYSEQNIMQNDVKKLNQDEIERVQGAESLFNSLVNAEKGDSSDLEKQVYIKYYLKSNSLHGEIRFTDKRINYLALRLKNKYADKDYITNKSIKIGANGFSAAVNKKLLEPEQIDEMLINFIFNFNDRFIEIAEKTSYNVPSIYSFKGKTDEHSNNKLLNYIIGSEGKTGVFENSMLKAIELEKDTVRHMVNGKSKKVNLNDLEVFSYEDINTNENENGNRLDVNELLGKEDSNYIDYDNSISSYQSTKEFAFVKDNYENVLTKNQLKKVEELLQALRTGKVEIDELLHQVTGELSHIKLGKIWFKGKENNYVQPQVKSLLDSMQSRMGKAIKLQNFAEDKEIESTYRTLKSHSAAENKLLADYKIWDKYIIRDLEVDEFHKDIDVVFKNSEQFIPIEEMEKIERKEQSVKDVINKYQITKKDVNNPHGSVKHYVIDIKNGEPLFTEKEIQEREDKHCKQLLRWIRERKITFTYNEDSKMYDSNTYKLHSITHKDYCRLVERPLALRDDKKELEIVKNNMNRTYFNTANRYVLRDTYYVDEKESTYTDLKDYNSLAFQENIDNENDMIDENIDNAI